MFERKIHFYCRYYLWIYLQYNYSMSDLTCLLIFNIIIPVLFHPYVKKRVELKLICTHMISVFLLMWKRTMIWCEKTIYRNILFSKFECKCLKISRKFDSLITMKGLANIYLCYLPMEYWFRISTNSEVNEFWKYLNIIVFYGIITWILACISSRDITNY